MSMDAINKGEVMATEEVKVDEGDSHELVFDSKEFAAMLRELKGEKPIREFAIETDLSESYLSKAVNGLVPSRPTKKTLAKLLDAVTDSKISRSDFLRAAGYSGVELTGRRVAATVGALNQLYGVDHFTAMGDFMRALATHGVNGDMASYFHRDAGYVEVTDQDTGQVYVCINGYVRPDEGEAVPIAFGVGITYGDKVKTFTQLAALMNKMAITSKRVLPRPVEADNERYIFRVWLVRIGMTGKEYAKARKILLEPLSGNSAFKDTAMEERWKARRKATEDGNGSSLEVASD